MVDDVLGDFVQICNELSMPDASPVQPIKTSPGSGNASRVTELPGEHNPDPVTEPLASEPREL
jgi:hypothetical protein